MIITNEPGYYLEGKFGIRVENMMEVEEGTQHNSDQDKFLQFRCLTLVPYCNALIVKEMLSARQKNIIKEHYKKIKEEIFPILEKKKKEEALGYCEKEIDSFIT